MIQDIRVVSSPPPEAPFAGTVMVKEAKEKELEATVLLRDRLRNQMFELIHMQVFSDMNNRFTAPEFLVKILLLHF